MESTEFKDRALPIEKMIQEKLSEDSWIIGENDDTPSAWTSAINTLLADVARSLHAECLIASKQKDIRDSTEWLYDFLCYEENEFGLDNVLFVAESQWINQWNKRENYDDIKYDFEKLILSRSQIRIMIFEANNGSEIQDYIERLNKIVAHSKLTKTDDRYMYVAWDIASQEFFIDLYIHI